MDKPTTPGGPGGPKSAWPDDSGSNQDLGATGVFGTVTVPETGRESSNSAPEPDLLAKWAPEAPKLQSIPQPPAPTPVAEPVVHKVVFGGGAAASSPELLDRLRMASAERAPTAEAAPESRSKGSGGFTELLRTLGNESPAPAPKEPPKPEPPRPVADSGFTSLLRTLGTPEPAAHQVARTVPPPPPSSSAPSSGGFTELLRAAPMASSTVESARTPAAGAPFPAAPAPTENQPGAFTQLFGTFGDAGAALSAPSPEVRNTAAPPPASAGSFTQMLSLEQQSTPVEPVYREERRPSTGSLDYSLPPVAPSPVRTNRDPFASPPPQPLESTPPGSGVGITRLIQMLDQPSMQPSVQPVPRQEPVPSSPRGAEPGIWTQTFASLAAPSEPAAPPAKAPDWTPPQATPTPPAYPVSREPQYPAMVSPPVSSPHAAPPASSGPSEFTRILDASRMRELAMREGAGAESLTPPQNLPAAPQFASPPIPPSLPPMLRYPIQAPPQPPGIQGMGGIPQPGGFPPPPAYPMQFGAQPGAMPSAPSAMPHQPGMFAPQAPPVKPPELAAAKTQQLLVVMGVVIIVLLVAILVTVIFLMKH